MKLIKKTYAHTTLWLLPVMLIGSIFCFFMIETIAYEETDEFLTYEMDRLIRYHEEHNDLPEFHKVDGILPGIRYESPVFKDTLILESGDNEMVPYRELYFTIQHKGRPFTIVLRHLLLGRDDIAEGTLLIIAGLMFLIAFIVVVIIHILANKLWKPFYNTLGKVTKYKTGDDLPVFEETSVDEFKTLNRTLISLLQKIDSDFRRTKEFNENLSHELKTQLAIIRSHTENLINEAEENSGEADGLKTIYTAVTKLSQVQKSLLLLSQISNMEYASPVETDMRPILEQSIDIFAEAIGLRSIDLNSRLENCRVHMDNGLAEVLVNNLVKNAVKHNIPGGFITVTLDPSSLIIENSGLPFQGDPDLLMGRFVKGEKGHYGIGLSIVKQICDLYNFRLHYEISDQSVHKITLHFSRT